MFLPNSKTKILWDSFISILTIAMAIEIPLRMVYGYPVEKLLLWFDIVLTVCYALDILVQFNTSIIIDMKLQTDRKMVTRNYLKSWFLADFIAMIPFDLIADMFPGFRMLKILRIMRLSRLVKLLRVMSIMNKIKKRNLINPSVLRLVYLIFWILLVAHYIACGWLFITGLSEELDSYTSYIQALYWTITTMTTIGYGDITPKGNIQTLYVMFIEIIGAGMYGFLIGNIANLLANIDIAKAQFQEKMERINTFLKYRKIPEDLQQQINNFYEYLWESRRGYDESSVLDELPVPLKTSVALFLNKEIIEKVPLFKGATDAFIREIILHLKPVVFSPGDYIFRKGDQGSEMYFINKGTVQVILQDGTVVASLTSGSFFGEIALLLSEPRNASIQAVDYADLYILEKETFDQVVKKYPDIAQNIKRLAQERLEKTQQQSSH